MRKDFLGYLICLLVGLGAAYYVSLPKSEKAGGAVEWASIKTKSITSIEYTSTKSSVRITKDSDGYKAQTEQVDESIKCDAAKGPCEEKKISDQFRLQKKFEDTLASFSPFYALRKLGKADELKLEDFGLKAPEATFVIKNGDKVLLDLAIGKKSFGSRNIFVMDKKNNDVLMVNGDAIEDVEKARNRLFQRELITIEFDTVTGAQLSSGDTKKEFERTKRDHAGELLWSEKGAEQPKPAIKTVMSQLQKINVQQYAKDEELPGLQALSPFVSIQLLKDAAVLGEVRFYKQTGEAHAAPKYWAFSSFLNTYVQINNARAEGLEKDLPTLIR